jgi:transposase
VLGRVPVPVIDEDVEAGYWRARAERAEARAGKLEAETAALRAERDELNARVAELAGQVARLQESVTTLSGLLFGSSSEKGDSPSRGNGRDSGDRPAGAGKRGQRPGGPGLGRRDYSHLETEERVIDVDTGQRCCAECGKPFEFLGTEDSEQIDWQVKITRVVWLRRRYRRACAHRGPATVCAPPAARPVPKGLFTAGFLARLAYEKHVLGRPVHRIVQALAADGLEVAAGTLCGALKQVAPLIAPWAEAIAAHRRQAGHVHADETSWQVFEDVADKDGHRWWLWVFVAGQTTVFVMDTSRSTDVAAGQLGIDREQSALEAGRRLVLCSDFHKAYQSLARADRGAVPGAPRPGGHHAGHRCARGRRGPLAAGLRRHRRAPRAPGQRRRQGPAAPGRRQGHRHADQRMGSPRVAPLAQRLGVATIDGVDPLWCWPATSTCRWTTTPPSAPCAPR